MLYMTGFAQSYCAQSELGCNEPAEHASKHQDASKQPRSRAVPLRRPLRLGGGLLRGRTA